MRFLTPTENKRLNELIGFLCIMLAVLMGLSLLTYNPRDVAFNVSAAAGEQNPTRNWIGPAGAYSADLLFQVFGFAAFLLPVAIGMLGYRWLRSRAIDSQAATIAGYVLLLMSLPSLLSLWHFPSVRRRCRREVAGNVDVARAAVGIQCVGREPGGDCAAGGGGVFGHKFFVQRGACVGQRCKGTHRAHGETGNFAARASAVARLAGRTRAEADAAGSGRAEYRGA